MASPREVALETDVQKRFKALWLAVESGTTAPPDRAPGLTADGRYTYRYDSEGRMYAAPFRPHTWPRYLNEV